MSRDDILQQRRLARQAKRMRDEDLVKLHERAANALRDDPEVRRRAAAQIEKWEKDALSSPRYISAWRDILNLPPYAARLAILREDDEGVALRQNSPFGFLAKLAR